jgi:threonine-phosphate decarboxylase
MRAPEAVRLPAHGGDPVSVAQRYGVDASTLIDFSSNVDPYGPPAGVRTALQDFARTRAADLSRYPEPTSAALREAFGRRHGVDAAKVVVANGSAALFDAVVRAVAPQTTVVPVPAFSEYRRAVEAAGSRYVAYALDAGFDWNDADLLNRIEHERATLLIVTNPHNPTGRLFSRDRLTGLCLQCARLGAFVTIDEAFVDYAEEASLSRDVPENAIVVRSLTKFFGMAGVRIGYALATETLAAAVASRVPSWPVGALDSAAALAALAEPGYAERVLNRNRVERERLTTHLSDLGIAVFGSAANFLFLELPCACAAMDSWIERMIRDFGIVVRDCRTYEGLETRSVIRVAVRTPRENARLIAALNALAREDA